jgi:hypothetical protein
MCRCATQAPDQHTANRDQDKLTEISRLQEMDYVENLKSCRSKKENGCKRGLAHFSAMLALANEHLYITNSPSEGSERMRRMHRSRSAKAPIGN